MKRCHISGYVFALGLPIVSSLAQRQIPMQHARLNHAWLPSEIFPKYGNVVEREKTIANRFQRATKRGKFSLAAWEFDVVLNSIPFYPDSYVFVCFKIAQMYLRSAASRVYKGHFKNE